MFIKEVGRVGSLSIRWIAGLHLFTATCYEISQTEGASMLPTLQVSGDFCVIDKRFKNGKDIRMGDLVVARKPTQPDCWVCKRVTGMPGDVVLLDPSRGSVEKLMEKYQRQLRDAETADSTEEPVPSNTTAEFEERFKEIKTAGKGNWNRDPYDMYIVVPEGHVWVTGDNLKDSVDSRTYSVLPMGLIEGKIIMGMYLPNWMAFKGEYYRWLANTFTEV